MPATIYHDAFQKLVTEKSTIKDGRRIIPFSIREMCDLLEKATGQRPSVSNVHYMLMRDSWSKQAGWTKQIEAAWTKEIKP